jgi:hypothetical protein
MLLFPLLGTPLGDQFAAVFQFELPALPFHVDVWVVGEAALAARIAQSATAIKPHRKTARLLRIALSLKVPALSARLTPIMRVDLCLWAEIFPDFSKKIPRFPLGVLCAGSAPSAIKEPFGQFGV